MRYGVDGGHLGKWRRVRIAHTSDNVITQFRDPHTPMIDFRHADKCWYSAAGTLLFWGPPLQHYLLSSLLQISNGAPPSGPPQAAGDFRPRPCPPLQKNRAGAHDGSANLALVSELCCIRPYLDSTGIQ